MLEVETDVAIVELAGEVGLDLATLLGGIASIAHAVAAAVEAANMETPVVIDRSEAHTSELQSLMRISYAVFCLKKKTKSTSNQEHKTTQHYMKIVELSNSK